MRTRVKICGITRRQDAEFAAEIGADAIGLVFYPESPRAINFAQAREIVATLPPFLSVVALFVDADADYVKQCLTSVNVDLLQFHGDEPEHYCQQFDKPYMKAIRMHDNIDFVNVANDYRSATAILVDSYQQGVPGGTGKVFNWQKIEPIAQPIVLAGGLTPDNISDAIAQVQPYAVDVSGGVEQSKGIKARDKMKQFIHEVNHG